MKKSMYFWKFIFTTLLAVTRVKCASFGEECFTDESCDDETGLKCFKYHDGLNYCSKGHCECEEDKVWLTVACGAAIGKVGDICYHNKQCNTIVTNSVCTGHRCVCDDGYYQKGDYQCLQGPGTTAINLACNDSNSATRCVKNLICSRCPGVTTGDMRCMSKAVSGADPVNRETKWIVMSTILITFIKCPETLPV